MSPLKPLDSGSRLLSIDKFLLQHETSDTDPKPPTRNISLKDVLDNLRRTVERLEKDQNEEPHVGEDGESPTGRQDAEVKEYKKLSDLFIWTNMSIYHVLCALDQRISRAEAAYGAQAGALELLPKFSDKMDRIDEIFEEEGYSLHEILESLKIKPAISEHVRVLLLNMNKFNAAQVERQYAIAEKLGEMHEGQSEMLAIVMGTMLRIHQVQVDQQEALMERFDEIQDEQEAQGEKLTKKLDHIHEFQHMQQYLYVKKLEEVHDEQLESPSNFLEKLNDIQQQQADMGASHSKWSVLMHGAQGRILDQLSALEEKIDAVVSDIAKVRDRGNKAEELALIELQDGPAAAIPANKTTMDAPTSGTNHPATPPTEPQAAEGANLKIFEERSTLEALFNVLRPVLLLSLILADLSGGY